MKKTIWIVNYYTGDPNVIPQPRDNEMARQFVQMGYRVIQLAAGHWSNISDQDFQAKKFIYKVIDGLEYIFIRVPSYQETGLKRFWSLFRFGDIIYHHCQQIPKPDCILHNILPPFDFQIVRTAKKLNVRYIAEACDLWPEDWVQLGVCSPTNPLLPFIYSIERWYYYNANEISFSMLGGIDYIKRKQWTIDTGGKIDLKHVHYINNGVNIAAFDQNRDLYPRPDAEYANNSVCRIVYLGSIHYANHVETLIQAAELLQSDPRYQFLIYGDGADRRQLEDYVRDHHLTNVAFKEKRIPLCEVAWVVSHATINIMNYQPKFGHAGVSSGKMFQYLAAGRPIICNIDIAYDDIITYNNLGVAHDITTAEDYATAIRQIADLPKEEYDAMCQRVRQTAYQFDYKKLSEQEIQFIDPNL